MERFDCIIRLINLIIHSCSFFEQYFWKGLEGGGGLEVIEMK